MRCLLTLLLAASCCQARAASYQVINEPHRNMPAVLAFVPDGYKLKDVTFRYVEPNPSARQTKIGAKLVSHDATIKWHPGDYGAYVPPRYRYNMKAYYNIPLIDPPSPWQMVKWHLPKDVRLIDTTQITSNKTLFHCMYPLKDGKNCEVLALATLNVNLPPSGATIWTGHVEALYTREGELEEHVPEFAQAVRNTRAAPEFAQALDGMQKRAIKYCIAKSDAAVAWSREFARLNDMRMDEIMDNWRRRNEIQDRSFEHWRDGFLGLDNFRTPDGDIIKLPNGGDTYWYGGDGSVIQGGHNYNPNEDRQRNNVDWTQIHRVDNY